MHYDPKYLPEPEKFDPERFLDEYGSYKSDERNIQFMLGKRVCIGQVRFVFKSLTS